MSISASDRVAKHRANLRASGLRPFQIWAPDTRIPGFVEQCIYNQLLLQKQTILWIGLGS